MVVIGGDRPTEPVEGGRLAQDGVAVCFSHDQHTEAEVVDAVRAATTVIAPNERILFSGMDFAAQRAFLVTTEALLISRRNQRPRRITGATVVGIRAAGQSSIRGVLLDGPDEFLGVGTEALAAELRDLLTHVLIGQPAFRDPPQLIPDFLASVLDEAGLPANRPNMDALERRVRGVVDAEAADCFVHASDRGGFAAYAKECGHSASVDDAVTWLWNRDPRYREALHRMLAGLKDVLLASEGVLRKSPPEFRSG